MLNEITIHGYLGRDPELTEAEGQNGPYKKVSFSVGVGRDYGDSTDWFRCVMYGKRAEVIDKFFRKGSEIIVSGSMESYKPKDDPNRTAWILKVNNFDFTRKSSGGADTAPGPIPETPITDEDIPF